MYGKAVPKAGRAERLPLESQRYYGCTEKPRENEE